MTKRLSPLVRWLVFALLAGALLIPQAGGLQAAPPTPKAVPPRTLPAAQPQAVPEGTDKDRTPSPDPAKPLLAAAQAQAVTAGPVMAREITSDASGRWGTLPAGSPPAAHGPHGAAGNPPAALDGGPLAGTDATGPMGDVWTENSPGAADVTSLATDSNGTIYIAYACYDSGEGAYDLCMTKSYDNGRDWHTFVVWDDALGFTGNQMQPDLVIDGNNKLWIAFRSTDAEGYFVWLTSTDGGAGWTINSISSWTWYAGVYYPSIAVSGTYVYIAFEYEYSTNDHDVYYAVSGDSGSTWGVNSLWGSAAHERYVAIAMSTYSGTTYVSVACEYEYSTSDHDIYFQYSTLGNTTWTSNNIATGSYDDRYPALAGSGAYLYATYEYYTGSAYNLGFFRSDTGGTGWTAGGGWDFGGAERYPAVAASGLSARLAFFDSTDVILALSSDGGASWPSAYTMTDQSNAVQGLHQLDTGYRTACHPPVAWRDNRNSTSAYDVYYDTLNNPPTITFSNVWPANGSTIHVFAPRLDFGVSGFSDDCDANQGYWWRVWPSGEAEPAGLTGGRVAGDLTLPWFTDPGVSYSWRVFVDDGYNLVQNATVWSFSTGTISHHNYFDGFDGTVIYPNASEFSYYTNALWEQFEDTAFPPPGWTTTASPNSWEKSSTYAVSGSYSAWSTYDTNLTTYSLTSPPLDLRGSTTAYYNHFFRGSSESGYDYFTLEASTDGFATYREYDRLSANWNDSWYYYPDGYMDLSKVSGMVGGNTGKVRLRFVTDQELLTGGGWYVDDAEVFRDLEWRSMNPGADGYYECSVASLGAYTNGVSDELYTPMIAMENSPDDYLHVWWKGSIPSPDYGRVYMLDLGTGTWTALGSVQGTQTTWKHEVYSLGWAWLNKNVVVALWLDSTPSSKEATGYWDVDMVYFSHSPTSVDLKSFKAWPEPPAVHIRWETYHEVDNQGFNLYRSNTRSGPKVKLNQALIPTKVPPGSPFGAVYDWIDTFRLRSGRRYFYWLEDVDVYGVATMHGPVRVLCP